jgi:GTPase
VFRKRRRFNVKKKFRAGFVSIVGRPNAGKSTLLNALIGEKLAITAPQAQTTRTSIQGIYTQPDAQIVFVDTPGIHQGTSTFNKKMMETVQKAVEGRDVLIYVADASKRPNDEDKQALLVLERAKKTILALNKVDKIEDKRDLLPLTEAYMAMHPFTEVVPVSARKADNLEALRSVTIEYLPEGPRIFPNDYYTDQPMRFLAGEIIREKILKTAKEEVPHATAVLIESWEEEGKLTRISAVIYVERPGQKTILIGKQGSMLKSIGTAARQDIEAMTGTKVFLSLFVKVRPNWRDDSQFLESIDWRSMVGSE